MKRYPFDGFTRVAFPPAVANLAAPTLDELRAVVNDYYLDVYTDEYIGEFEWVYDIHCELTANGLNLPKSTESYDTTPWKSTMRREIPTRFSMSGTSLEAFRFRQPEPGILWHGSGLKSTRVLVVRRGVPVEQEWAAGDEVETYRVITGKRATASSSPDTAVTFTIPLFVQAEDDEAVLVA